MNRLLLPAGLALAGLVAFDSVFDQHQRLAQLERAAVCRPEQLSQLSERMKLERAAWTSAMEERMADERELAVARTRVLDARVARLQELLAEQQATLDLERRRL